MNSSEILEIVARYHRASTRRIHLIPSENAMSLRARMPFITDIVHRYCFSGDGDNWAWPGNCDLTQIENSAITTLAELFRARYVNLKPVSGINCMAVILSALTKPGGTVFSLAKADGGHGSTGFLTERLGLTNIALPYNGDRYAVDVDQLAVVARVAARPIVIYLDQFMCLFPHDIEAIRLAVGPDTTIHYDGSHVMGLIAGRQFQDPLSEGADSLGGSTHKSFPGPHKGVVLTNSFAISEKINEHASFWVSHHHPADVAALAIAVSDLQPVVEEYAARTVHNAQYLGCALAKCGFDVCAAERGFTRSHQLWMDVAPIIDPYEASRRLLEAGIVINAIDVPYLPGRTGLRLGVQEVTRLGMGTADMDHLANMFARLLIRREEPAALVGEVQEMLDQYSQAEDDSNLAAIMRMIDIAASARGSYGNGDR